MISLNESKWLIAQQIYLNHSATNLKSKKTAINLLSQPKNIRQNAEKLKLNKLIFKVLVWYFLRTLWYFMSLGNCLGRNIIAAGKCLKYFTLNVFQCILLVMLLMSLMQWQCSSELVSKQLLWNHSQFMSTVLELFS